MLQGTANHGIEKILVPTDFSPSSAIALEYALAVASQMRASITVYHSYELMAGLASEDYEPAIKEKMKQTEQDLAQQLSLFVQAYRDVDYKLGGGKVIIETMVKLGSIGKEIAKMTADDAYDLVVMGTKGASGVDEVMFGSVASSIVEVVNCPMLIVPEKAILTEIDLIAYGTNFEKADTVVIDELIEWAGYFNNARIDCLHVNTNPSQSISKQQKLEELAKQYKDVKNLHFSLLEDNTVTQGLDNYMTGKQPDMMAVLRREKTFLEKLFRTSVSKKLTFHSKVPVLILKTKKS
jgi:nucleotide-binding universal stress UspA family protein